MDRDVQRIITKDRSSGMIHLRLVVDGKEFTQEGCNLDDAGSHDTLEDLPTDIDLSMFCRNDFPLMHDQAKNR